MKVKSQEFSELDIDGVKLVLTKNKRKYVCDCQICEVDICCVSTILILRKCGDFRCIPQIFVIENDNTGSKVSKDPNNKE